MRGGEKYVFCGFLASSETESRHSPGILLHMGPRVGEVMSDERSGVFRLFGALFFFFMMRFGCGSHVGHGGHAGHGGGARRADPGSGGGSGSMPTTNVDPVCGMRVDDDMGYTKMYRGKTYRFCNELTCAGCERSSSPMRLSRAG